MTLRVPAAGWGVYLLSAILISGCSALAGKKKDKPQPLQEIVASTETELLWEQAHRGRKNKYRQLRPMVREGIIYSAFDREVIAIDAQNGDFQWYYTHNIPLAGGVGYGEGRILVSDIEGWLLIFDAAEGELLQRHKLPGLNRSVPILNDNRVLLNLSNGTVLSLNALTGSSEWTFRIKQPQLTLYGNSAPKIAGNLLLVGTDDGQLIALAQDSGLEAWSYRLGRQLGRTVDSLADVDAAPLIHRGIVYASSNNGRTAALEVDSGALVWDEKFSSISSVAVVGNCLVAVSTDDTIRCFDRRNGRELWSQDALLRRYLSSPAAVGGYFVVCDYEGVCHILSAESGAIEGRFTAGQGRTEVLSLGQGPLMLTFDSRGDLRTWQLRTIH